MHVENPMVYKCGIGGCLFLTRRQSDLTRHRRRHVVDGAAHPYSSPGAMPVSNLITPPAPVSITDITIQPSEFADMKRLPNPDMLSLEPVPTVYAPQCSPISSVNDDLNTAMDSNNIFISDIAPNPNTATNTGNTILSITPNINMDSQMTAITTSNDPPSTTTLKPSEETFKVMDNDSPILAGEIYYTVDGLNFSKVPADLGDRFQLTPMGLTRISTAEPPMQQILIKGNFNFQLVSCDN
jgi:hypothetical protein